MYSYNRHTKIFANILLIILICFSLAACGQNPALVPQDSPETAAPSISSASELSSSDETATELSSPDDTATEPQTEEQTPTPEASTTQAQEETTNLTIETTAVQTTEETTSQEESTPPAIDLSHLQYEEETITFTEKENGYTDFSVSCQMRTMTVNGRKYCFDLSIPEEDCTERIRFTEEKLMQARISQEICICLYDNEKVRSIYTDGQSLYSPMFSMDDTDYLAAVLLAAYGEFSNYGMAYGYAALLSGEELPEAQYPQEWDYYDLNILCFLPQFTSEEDIENVKAVALDLAGDLVEMFGHKTYQTLLGDSGRLTEAESVRKTLLAYYRRRGIATELSPLMYAPGGTTYTHIMRCENATFYTEKGWTPLDAASFGIVIDDNTPDLIKDLAGCTASYAAYRRVFESYRIEMQQLKAFFSPYFYSYGYLDVFFLNRDTVRKNGILANGYYDTRSHKIYLLNGRCDGYIHEFIHSLTYFPLETGIPWYHEGLTSYYALNYSKYHAALYDYSCRVSISNMTGSFGNTAQAWLDSQEGDLLFINYYDFCTYHYGYSVDDAPYDAGTAFIDYLIKRFGEEAVLDYFLFHHDLSQLTDKSMEGLLGDWKLYQQERYRNH